MTETVRQFEYGKDELALGSTTLFEASLESKLFDFGSVRGCSGEECHGFGCVRGASPSMPACALAMDVPTDTPVCSCQSATEPLSQQTQQNTLANMPRPDHCLTSKHKRRMEPRSGKGKEAHTAKQGRTELDLGDYLPPRGQPAFQTEQWTPPNFLPHAT